MNVHKYGIQFPVSQQLLDDIPDWAEIRRQEQLDATVGPRFGPPRSFHYDYMSRIWRRRNIRWQLEALVPGKRPGRFVRKP
jgi:hypothetical protein